ncbi:hypothetical protein D3C81_1940760 [compost metagenome]
MFGVIHRRVSVEHQLTIGFSVVRIERNTDTDGHDQLVKFDIERAVNGADQRIGKRSGIIRATDFREQNKLVAADAGEGELAFQR